MPPVFNGGDVGDVEDGDHGDDVTPAQELVNSLEDHPPEQEGDVRVIRVIRVIRSDHPPEQVGDVRVRLTKKNR